MTDEKSKYSTYILNGLHPSIFGETHIIITSTKDNEGKYEAEYFILMQRPNETLAFKTFNDVGNPNQLEMEKGSNLDSALDFGLSEAERDLDILLEKRTSELNRPDLAHSPFELIERNSPFVSFRMRGKFTEQLMKIKNNTKCRSLANFQTVAAQVNMAIQPNKS